jgi:hypothetical protein
MAAGSRVAVLDHDMHPAIYNRAVTEGQLAIGALAPVSPWSRPVWRWYGSTGRTRIDPRRPPPVELIPTVSPGRAEY